MLRFTTSRSVLIWILKSLPGLRGTESYIGFLKFCKPVTNLYQTNKGGLELRVTVDNPPPGPPSTIPVPSSREYWSNHGNHHHSRTRVFRHNQEAVYWNKDTTTEEYFGPTGTQTRGKWVRVKGKLEEVVRNVEDVSGVVFNSCTTTARKTSRTSRTRIFFILVERKHLLGRSVWGNIVVFNLSLLHNCVFENVRTKSSE